MELHFRSEFFSNFCLPWKTEGSLNLLYRIYIFYYSGVLSNIRLPWKTELPWNFSLYWIYCTLYIQEFWATCLWPEKQSCPEIFRCMEYTLYIHNFWAACPCSEKQNCPDIFHCIEQTLFIIQRSWLICACPEKQRAPWNFSLCGIYFSYSGVIGHFAWACPEKQRAWYFLLFWTCIFYHSAFFSN